MQNLRLKVEETSQNVNRKLSQFVDSSDLSQLQRFVEQQLGDIEEKLSEKANKTSVA